MKAKFSSLIVLVSLLAGLAGCGGAKILKEPVAMESVGPLAIAQDDELAVVLDWVIVRHGPGTWSRDAYWDEYLLRVANMSDSALSITAIEVIDHLEQPIPPLTDRRKLEKATRKVSKRYKKQGYDIAPGANGGHMVAAGTGAFIGGTGIVYAGVAGVLAGGSGIATASAWAATGLYLASPVILAVGLVKAVNNEQVDKRIQARQTVTPVKLAAGEEVNLDVFFPVTPSPLMVRVVYETAAGQQTLAMLTAEPMQGLHIKEKHK